MESEREEKCARVWKQWKGKCTESDLSSFLDPRASGWVECEERGDCVPGWVYLPAPRVAPRQCGEWAPREHHIGHWSPRVTDWEGRVSPPRADAGGDWLLISFFAPEPAGDLQEGNRSLKEFRMVGLKWNEVKNRKETEKDEIRTRAGRDEQLR